MEEPRREMGWPSAAARRLLLSSSHPVTRIAVLTGFGNIYHFSRQFKQRTGRSPTRFRKLGPDGA